MCCSAVPLLDKVYNCKCVSLFVLQACGFEDQAAKHQTLLRSSSEPSQPTFQSTHTPDHVRTAGRRSTEENTPEQGQTNTDHCTDTHDDTQTHSTPEVTHTPQKPVGRGTVVKDKAQVTHVENEAKKDANMEPVEREESTGILRWVVLPVQTRE